MAFDLRPPYPPRGDQPEAIAQLLDGLRGGQRYQTLLGVTGSGKSLAWDEPVLIRTRRADGGYNSRLCPIGTLVDAAMGADTLGHGDGNETEVAAAPDGLEARSFNPPTGATEWRTVTGVSRHAAPLMFRVRTACGREATVTGDHN